MFGSWNPSQYKAMSASGLVKLATGLCALQGILCSTSSTAKIEVWDTLTDETNANAVKVLDDLTMTAGQSYPMPAKINYGLYVKLVSGTGAWTIFFD